MTSCRTFVHFIVPPTLSAVVLFLTLIPTAAPSDTGNITGRVTGTTGTAIAGAKVAATQTAMNFEVLVETSAEGIYRARSLRPGPYRVTVPAPGCKRFVRANLELRMGDAMAVEATLEVGAPTGLVEVSAAAALLETGTSSAGAVATGNYFPVKERMIVQVRPDFQDPFKWYIRGASATQSGINSVANSRTVGTYTPGNEGTAANFGGLPAMNLTLAPKW